MRKTQGTDIKIFDAMILCAGFILAGFLPAWMSPALAASPPAPAAADVKVTGVSTIIKPDVQDAAYRYSPAGKADPFRSFVTEEAAREEAAKKKQSLQAKTAAINILQRHDANQYILVGIASDEKSRSAMIIDPTKKYFFVVNVGTYIGLNMGRVKEILNDQIIIEEKVKMDDGKIKPRKVVIRFQ
jgi:Tfp pilus assembly protein PilP